jgi:Bacterial Ig-like domain (group 3)
MRLKRTLAVLASAAAGTLAAGMMLASPASAAPHAPSAIHPDGTTFTALSLSTSSYAFAGGVVEIASFGVQNIMGPNPTGTVSVFAGNTLICSGTLRPVLGQLNVSQGTCAVASSSMLVPATYQVVADYSGDNAGDFASASGAKSLTITQGVTTATLQESADLATFGGEHNVALFGNVSPASGQVSPTGNYTITDENGNRLCSGQVDGNGNTACMLSDTALHPGGHNLFLSYAGDSNYTGSISDPLGIFIEKAGTTTSMTLPATSLAADEEGGLLVNYQVSSSAGVTPTGTVTVSANGMPICAGSLSGGAGNCAIPGGALAPGSYQVTANYGGDSDNAVSSSAPQTLTITGEPTKTVVSLSAGKITFGHEQAERISVKVKPRTSGTPTGKVTIKAGSVTVCVAKLKGGKGSCSPGATKLNPGVHHLTASYGGDATFAGSSGQATLTVAAEPTATSLALSTGSVRSGHEQAERLSVQVRPAIGGTPAGQVTIKAGSVTVCVVTLNFGKGTCTLSASKLRPGTYLLAARYGGKSPFAASASARKTLTVTG